MSFGNLSIVTGKKNAPVVFESMLLLDVNGLVGLIFNHEKYHFLLELLSYVA